MREKRNLTVNKMPAPTWRWLRLNYYNLNEVELPESVSVLIDPPDEVELKETREFSVRDVVSGMGEDMMRLAESSEAPIHRCSIAASRRTSSPVKITAVFSDQSCQVVNTELLLGASSKMTVIMDFSSQEEATGLGTSHLRYNLGAGARLKLIQVIRAGQDYSMLSDIGGICEEGACFELIQIVLGGRMVFLGANTKLLGKDSKLTSHLGYMMENDGYLDVNYVADHVGKRTGSDITVGGVLRDQSKKVFRGTIDFKKGCSGAIGSEIEDVLLMDDDVVNQTIPVILCSEEDVEGSHGATVGKLSDDLLFYLMSRGVDESSVYEMMARARIDAVCQNIKDEETRKIIFDELDEMALRRREMEV